MEYVPNGQIIQSRGRIDPDDCVGALLQGSITVSDGGVFSSVADDAFAVILDGVELGRTTIGGINTLAANNLRSGTATLGIRFVEGGGCGSYLVELSQGLIFSGGGTSREACIALGTTDNYTIVIPQ